MVAFKVIQRHRHLTQRGRRSTEGGDAARGRYGSCLVAGKTAWLSLVQYLRTFDAQRATSPRLLYCILLGNIPNISD